MKKSLIIITEFGEDDFSSSDMKIMSDIFHPEMYSCDRLLKIHECISMAYSAQVLVIEGHLSPLLDESFFSSLPFLEKIFLTEPVPYITPKRECEVHIIDDFSSVPLAEEALHLLMNLVRSNVNAMPQEVNSLSAGLIGLSPAAIYLAKVLGSLGMNVLYHDPIHKKSAIGHSMDFFDVISRSDAVFLCRNLQGRGTLINDEVCNVFKGGSLLINLLDMSYLYVPSVIDAMKRDIIHGLAMLKSHYIRSGVSVEKGINYTVSDYSPSMSKKARKAMVEEIVHKIIL